MQYQNTDQRIFALGAGGAGAFILSKVPKHGADEIQHMNTAYGAIWLRAFLPGLAAQV